MFWVFLILFVGIVVALVVRADHVKSRRLAAAPLGSVQIESCKAQHVGQYVKQYANAGWTVVDQTSAKSLGSQARVTITFKKVKAVNA